MEERTSTEKRFHDSTRKKDNHDIEIQQNIGQCNKCFAPGSWYAITRRSKNKVFEFLKKNSTNSTILDYCCGDGGLAILVAGFKDCEVVGIDISEVSIENAKQSAIDKGLSQAVKFYVMDAENMSFDDNSFDIIYCSGVIHHLEISSAYSELARVLKPSGKIIMNEPLIYNPVIHYYRKKTPYLRTDWEVDHILRKRDIELAKEYFNSVDILGFYHLFTIAAVFFRNTRIFPMVLRVLETLDSIVLKLPLVKWLAWQVVFVAESPKR